MVPKLRPVAKITDEIRCPVTTSEPRVSAAPTATPAGTLARLLGDDPPPFAVLYRPEADPRIAEILLGELVSVERTADLPEPAAGGLPVLAVVPFRQIRERGFDVVDDGVPLLVLRASERVEVPLADLIELLPDGPRSFVETGYDVSDAEYEGIVRDVLADEIAAGAGSNFVVHRCLTGRFDPEREPPARAALGVLRRLLLGERRAYWTFVVHTPQSTFVGASPERHVSLDAGVARMNPISGTLRYPAAGWASADSRRDAVLAFLADPKERDELAMVVDEELKMMALLTTGGDRAVRVRGPYLKEMAHLAHTEYVIEGRTTFDARQVLRATMFAPTVTGSPIRNACRVIARHESRGRRYYGGVLALIGRDAEGGARLDSPILIRTAEIAADGSVRVAAGATLVRGSTPESELAETRVKAAGIVAALMSDPAPLTSARDQARPQDCLITGGGDGVIQAVLQRRNATLARFWLPEQGEGESYGGEQSGGEQFGGERGGEPFGTGVRPRRRITVINAEDDFTGMLAHLLVQLGFAVDVHPWSDLSGAQGAALAGAELVVLGPGPGDPNDLADPRIQALHRLARARLAASAPVLGVCLGHQILCVALGLRVERLPRPDQGRQRPITLFGVEHRVGFYNSYGARYDVPTPGRPVPDLTFSLDETGEQVQAFRGEQVTGLQFHPESVLTTAGLEILGTELARLGTRANRRGRRPRD